MGTQNTTNLNFFLSRWPVSGGQPLYSLETNQPLSLFIFFHAALDYINRVGKTTNYAWSYMDSIHALDTWYAPPWNLLRLILLFILWDWWRSSDCDTVIWNHNCVRYTARSPKGQRDTKGLQQKVEALQAQRLLVLPNFVTIWMFFSNCPPPTGIVTTSWTFPCSDPSSVLTRLTSRVFTKWVFFVSSVPTLSQKCSSSGCRKTAKCDSQIIRMLPSKPKQIYSWQIRACHIVKSHKTKWQEPRKRLTLNNLSLQDVPEMANRVQLSSECSPKPCSSSLNNTLHTLPWW